MDEMLLESILLRNKKHLRFCNLPHLSLTLLSGKAISRFNDKDNNMGNILRFSQLVSEYRFVFMANCSAFSHTRLSEPSSFLICHGSTEEAGRNYTFPSFSFRTYYAH